MPTALRTRKRTRSLIKAQGLRATVKIICDERAYVRVAFGDGTVLHLTARHVRLDAGEISSGPVQGFVQAYAATAGLAEAVSTEARVSPRPPMPGECVALKPRVLHAAYAALLLERDEQQGLAILAEADEGVDRIVEALNAYIEAKDYLAPSSVRPLFNLLAFPETLCVIGHPFPSGVEKARALLQQVREHMLIRDVGFMATDLLGTRLSAISPGTLVAMLEAEIAAQEGAARLVVAHETTGPGPDGHPAFDHSTVGSDAPDAPNGTQPHSLETSDQDDGEDYTIAYDDYVAPDGP